MHRFGLDLAGAMLLAFYGGWVLTPANDEHTVPRDINCVVRMQALQN